MLIDLALFNAVPTLVPEVKVCDSGDTCRMYRLIDSTQISKQPLQVNKSKGNTLDVFTTLIGGITTKNEKEQALVFLSHLYQFVPPIIVAHTDTTIDSIKNASKREEFLKALNEYRRGYGLIPEIMGIFFSQNTITVYILKSGLCAPNSPPQLFLTTQLEDIRRLILLINEFLHKQTIPLKQIQEICKVKYNDQFKKKPAKQPPRKKPRVDDEAETVPNIELEEEDTYDRDEGGSIEVI